MGMDIFTLYSLLSFVITLVVSGIVMAFVIIMVLNVSDMFTIKRFKEGIIDIIDMIKDDFKTNWFNLAMDIALLIGFPFGFSLASILTLNIFKKEFYGRTLVEVPFADRMKGDLIRLGYDKDMGVLDDRLNMRDRHGILIATAETIEMIKNDDTVIYRIK